jgi:hypothetical protein
MSSFFEESEMLPCPFCGRSKYLKIKWGMYSQRVICEGTRGTGYEVEYCWALGPPGCGVAEAVGHWNSRSKSANK